VWTDDPEEVLIEDGTVRLETYLDFHPWNTCMRLFGLTNRRILHLEADVSSFCLLSYYCLPHIRIITKISTRW
jgi:hypothetical protein